MADGTGHKILTTAAIESLPKWMQTLIEPEKARLENDYCMYGDAYFVDQESIGPYIELPDGRLPMDPWEIRHFRKDAPGKDYYTCGYYDLMRYSFNYFADKCIDAIKHNDIATFAKFVGSIAHVIEDCGTPPHAVGTEMGTDMKMLKHLYPCHDRKKMASQFHSVLERKFEPFSMDYSPELLGLSPAEISFNMLERFTDMVEHSISFIIPLLDAYYCDNDKKLAEILSECGTFSSEIVADFIYSVISVGTQRIGDQERESLASISVSDYTPIERTAWAPTPYPYAEIRKAPWNLNDRYEPVELRLLLGQNEIKYEKGFGLGPPFEITYNLPENVYTQFSSIVGINHLLNAEAGLVFAVFGDGVKLAEKKCVSIHDTQSIDCTISHVQQLTLTTSAVGNLSWPNNTHAVWGNPTLSK